jgi:hypothetical protein
LDDAHSIGGSARRIIDLFEVIVVGFFHLIGRKVSRNLNGRFIVRKYACPIRRTLWS